MRNLKILYHFQNFSMLVMWWRHANLTKGHIFCLNCWRCYIFWRKYVTSEHFLFYCGSASSNLNHRLHQNRICRCPNDRRIWIHSFFTPCNTRTLFLNGQFSSLLPCQYSHLPLACRARGRIKWLCFWGYFDIGMICAGNTQRKTYSQTWFVSE
jgi:hypothetical protein